MKIYELKYRIKNKLATKEEIKYYQKYVEWMKKFGFIRTNKA